MEEIKILKLEPGDCLVVFHPGSMGSEQKEAVKVKIRDSIGGHLPILVLTEGMTMSVLRAPNEKEVPTPSHG